MNPDPRRWLAPLAALLALGTFISPVLSAAHAAPAAPTAGRPNIVFVLSDDQRWGSLGATGNPVVRTPHLDRLAAAGVRFESATVNSAICTPSRACFFLGQYERKHGLNFNSGTALSEEAWSQSYPVLQTISGIDRLVGAITAKLEQLGCADNTVIVFSSDHGVLHGEFGLGGKALNYEACLRVPLIAFDPRTADQLRTHRSPALVQSIDVAPTLLDLAGVPVPRGMQGESFRAALEGREFPGRPYAFSENLWTNDYGNPRCESVRTTDWKYIRYFKNDRSLLTRAGGAGGAITDELAAAYAGWLTATIRGEPPVYEELYDLRADPDEAVNLAADPAYAARLRELRAACQRLVREARGNLDDPPATVRVRGARDARGQAPRKS